MQRLLYASKTALLHLLGCAIVAALIYLLVFNFWLDTPFSELSRAKDIFLLILIVDLILGPLVTLIIANPDKSRAELSRDLSWVVLIQLAALAYGVHTLMQVRPIWIGFEKNHFRVISVQDVRPLSSRDAPEGLRSMNWLGPQPIGVRMIEGSDPGFLASLELSLAGYHTAYRPSHWVPFASQIDQVIAAAQPVEQLLKHHGLNDLAAVRHRSVSGNWTIDDLLYLPLSTDQPTDWSVLIDRNTGQLAGYVQLSGWND